MNNKYIITLLAVSSLCIGKSNPVQALAVNLYDGSGLPENQGYLAPGAINVNPTIQEVNPSGSGVSINTNENGTGTGYFGYSNHIPNPSNTTELLLVNPVFPTLNANNGYSLFFDVAVTPEVDNSVDRGAFSVMVISSNLKGIELDFDDNQIFAQSDTISSGMTTSDFTQAENTLFTTSENTSYELKINSTEYNLFANSNATAILSGALRDYEYDINATDPQLPFNPYETPNFIFLGDLTDQASGTFVLESASLNTSSVPFNFSPTLGLALIGISISLRKFALKKD